MSGYIGYGLALDRVFFTGLIGILFVEEVDAGRTSQKAGFTGLASFSAQPMDNLVLSGSLTYSTLNHNYQLIAKAGFKTDLGFIVGPETKLSGSTRSWNDSLFLQQRQFGVHISNVPLGRAWLGVAGGVLIDRDMGSGPYLGLNVGCCR